MKISIITLGCKVNQYESGALKEELLKMGHEVSMHLEPADLFVLNTCAVTGIAEKKSRANIAKISPTAKVIVCGCASEHSKEQFSKKLLILLLQGDTDRNSMQNAGRKAFPREDRSIHEKAD